MDKINDKLPEEMQKQINKNAIAADVENQNKTWEYRAGYRAGHKAGATAWAPWKVKYDELQVILNKHLRTEQELLKSAEAAHALSQRMADALEAIANAPLPANENERLSWIYTARNLASENLQQFKDGKGKEVEPVKEIEYMPIHPEDARKPGCPKQFPMHLLSEDQAQKNHGQTLKRLKDRGGLGITEILAIVHRKKWSHYASLHWADALSMLNEVLTNPQK